MKIELIRACYRIGEQVEIRLHPITRGSFDHLNVAYTPVEETIGGGSSSGGDVEVEWLDDTALVRFPRRGIKRPGLYHLSMVKLLRRTGSELQVLELFRTGEIINPVFYVCSAPELLLTFDQVYRLYDRTIAARQHRFMSGFGDRPTNGDTLEEFECLLFIKNALTRNEIRLGQYRLIPYNGPGVDDQIAIINSFIATSYPHLPRAIQDEERRSRYTQGQPSAVVHFPRVFAADISRAIEIVREEGENLTRLLALQGGHYGESFGYYIYDKSHRNVYWDIFYPTYRGNLLGNWLDEKSGEAKLGVLRGNARAQLYASLYKEANREVQTEFAYFRLWNLLETIARSKDYVGAPLLDWNGTPVLKRSGIPRTIEDRAEQLVFENLRRLRIARDFGGMGIDQSSIEQLIPIWYRHRNCVVHGGGCFPDDPQFCLRNKSQYANCRMAHLESVRRAGQRGRYDDQYLRVLSMIAQAAVEAEL